MASPLQEPKIALPGAEFFAMAPGRDIILGPRLFASQVSTLATAPVGGGAGAAANVVVEPNWGTSSGIYIVRAYVLFVPNDNTGELTINQARMGLGQAGANIFLDIGIPTATFSNPASPQIVIYDRDALVTYFDTPNFPQNTALFFDTQVTAVNHDPTNPRAFAITAVIIYHQMRGFVQ